MERLPASMLPRDRASLAHFQPYHHRETRGNYKGDPARPHGNAHPMHRDLPAQGESQQLQYGNQRKENDSDDGKRLLHVLSPLTAAPVRAQRWQGRARSGCVPWTDCWASPAMTVGVLSKELTYPA